MVDREIFALECILFFAPFAFVASSAGNFKTWANSIVSNYFFLKTTLGGQFQENEKLFASQVKNEDIKITLGEKITLYRVLV